jgi:hypothetical protein
MIISHDEENIFGSFRSNLFWRFQAAGGCERSKQQGNGRAIKFQSVPFFGPLFLWAASAHLRFMIYDNDSASFGKQLMDLPEIEIFR